MSVGEEGWETASTEAQIEFAGTADADPVVRMQVDEGVSFGYGVDDAHPVAGRADASTLTYENARPNADVEFMAGSGSVKETLVPSSARVGGTASSASSDDHDPRVRPVAARQPSIT